MVDNQSQLDMIVELVLDIFSAINEFFGISADVIVLMYARAFENMFGTTSHYVMVGKGVFLAILVGMVMRWIMQIISRIAVFTRPIRLKPSLVGVEINSPLYQTWVTFWTIFKNSLFIWLAVHILLHLLKSINY